MNLSSSQLRKAASLQDKIEALQKELASLLGSPSSGGTVRKRRKMSAAARKRIADAQRARWAKQKAAAKAAK